MKKALIFSIIFVLILGSACTNTNTSKNKISFDEFYKFKLLSSYDECVNLLKDSKLDYTVREIHDEHGNGVIISVENVMKINNKEVSLFLQFPDRIKMVNKFVDFNSEVLLSFSYRVRDIDLKYAKNLITYCNEFFGKPIINQFEEDLNNDSNVKFVSWDNSSYKIYSTSYLEDEMNSIVDITFNITDEQRIFAEKEF